MRYSQRKPALPRCWLWCEAMDKTVPRTTRSRTQLPELFRAFLIHLGRPEFQNHLTAFSCLPRLTCALLHHTRKLHSLLDLRHICFRNRGSQSKQELTCSHMSEREFLPTTLGCLVFPAFMNDQVLFRHPADTRQAALSLALLSFIPHTINVQSLQHLLKYSWYP